MSLIGPGQDNYTNWLARSAIQPSREAIIAEDRRLLNQFRDDLAAEYLPGVPEEVTLRVWAHVRGQMGGGFGQMESNYIDIAALVLDGFEAGVRHGASR